MAEKILVIDDEKSIGELIQIAMQAKGYKVEFATTGGDGIALFHRFGPDIVLVDKRLPDMDGMDVARQIKQTEAGKKVPVMLMTGDISEKGMDQSLFVAIIEKPISMSHLIALVEGKLKPQSH